MPVVSIVLFFLCPLAALLFFVRLICSLFSAKVLDQMGRHPVIHAIWGCLAFLVVLGRMVLTIDPKGEQPTDVRIPVTQMSNEVLLRQLLDAIPSYVFLVDKDVSILDYNAAAGAFLGIGRRRILRHRGG